MTLLWSHYPDGNYASANFGNVTCAKALVYWFCWFQTVAKCPATKLQGFELPVPTRLFLRLLLLTSVGDSSIPFAYLSMLSPYFAMTVVFVASQNYSVHRQIRCTQEEGNKFTRRSLGQIATLPLLLWEADDACRNWISAILIGPLSTL